MKRYKTCDGIKDLETIGGGLLYDPDTNESYERKAVKLLSSNLDKWKLLVLYWTPSDRKNGSLSPSGRAVEFISKDKSFSEACSMIEGRRKYKNKVYDIELQQ